MPRQKPIPQRLKRLEATDYLQVRDGNGDILVVTKQETKAVIKEMLEYEYELLSRRAIQKVQDILTEQIENRISQFEKEADAFINHKIDEMAHKICDMLVMRKFKEEIEKRAQELLLEYKANGKF